MACFSHLLLQCALMVLALLTNWAYGYCRHGSTWIEHDGSCYYWGKDSSNWFKAELNCRKFGGGLASVGKVFENDLLLKLTYCSVPYWIGLVNIHPGLRGNPKTGYEWWDGRSYNYTALISPNANDYEDCVYTSTYPSGIWHNLHCHAQLNYVCKVPSVTNQLSGEEQQSADAARWSNNTAAGFYTTFEPYTDGATESAATAIETESTSPTPTLQPTTVAPTALPRMKCQPGWQQLDNNCYLYSENATNYFNAQMSCEAVGATVTSILTERELLLLRIYLGCNAPTWIGLEKARPCFRHPNQDHCWVWMDRSPVHYSEWASGQPQNRLESECVILDGQWKVENCYNQYRYLCKKSMYHMSDNA